MNGPPGSRDFLLIWAGQLVSAVGSGLSSFALSLWVLRSTGSTTEFAFTFLATALPAMAVSPVVGVIVDRWDRRTIMIGCDLLSALVTLVLAGLLAMNHLAVWHVYIGVGATALFDAFRSPCLSAAVPMLVRSERLARANAMVQTGNAIAGIVSPLFAGVLVSLVSFGGVLLIDAATFLAGLLTLALATIPPLARRTREVRQTALSEAAAGWRYVRERPGLIGLLTVYGANSFAFAMACVLIAPLLLSFSNAMLLGVQYATSGLGLFIGGLAIATFGGPKRRGRAVLICSMLGGLALAAHGLRPSYTLAVVAGLALFTLLPVISTSNSAIWQSKIPADLQGRCFAIQHLVFNAVTAAGYLLAGPLSERVFEPLLAPGGALAGSAGAFIGTGGGRGIGLMFILIGVLMSAVAFTVSRFPATHNVDDLPEGNMPQQNTSACSEAAVSPGGKLELSAVAREAT
jgi:MFS transporter, DHA3 family, macrolide efflux protein